MFRKLVSSLPFSPALVGQLGFYIKRLKKEEATRRLGLVFTILAVIMQSFTVFSPPEPILASSGSDIIPGGINSIPQILGVYDASVKGQNDFKDLLDYIGITRDEIANMNPTVQYVHSSDKDWISFGRQHHYSASEGEIVHKVPLRSGGFSTFYSVPLYRFDSVNNMVNWYDSYIGKSAKIGEFAIMRKCGNIEIKKKVQKVPLGKLVSATCKAIQGYAYDERQASLSVKVYLYFNGPPGKGKQFGPFTANQATPTTPIGGQHGFNFEVPAEYQVAGQETIVWAALQPLAGWNQPLVQFSNTVKIPGNCQVDNQPTASCSNLSFEPLTRTTFKLHAGANASGGATIKAYQISIYDESGKKVYDKTIASTDSKIDSEVISITSSGKYKAVVIVTTSLGDKTSTDCEVPFEISKDNKCPYPGSGDISTTDSNCDSCPYNSEIWINSDDCLPTIVESKIVSNLTKKIDDANKTMASLSDKLEFTVYTTNVGNLPITASVSDGIADILEYSELLDPGGGTLDQKTKVLSWGDVKLDPNQTDTRHFVIRLFNQASIRPQGVNNPSSFDCVMTNSYGNTIEVKVACPAVKSIETVVKRVPPTGPGENIVFATVLLMGVTYFYTRSRQLRKEIEIVRKEV